MIFGMSMGSNPSWNSSYRVEVLSHDKVLLFDENNCKILDGRVFSLLAPLLDGEHSIPELEERLGSQVFLPELSYALELGKARGFIVEDSQRPEQASPFWHAHGVGLSKVQMRSASKPVRVWGIDGEPVSHLETALKELGVRLAEETAEFTVVVTDDYLHPALDEFNRRSLEQGHSWMLVRPFGNSIWVGPVFRPDSTGCWECLAQRLRSNRMVENHLERVLEKSIRAPLSRLPTSRRMALDIAATEVTKALAADSGSRLDGRVLTFDMITMESRLHELVKRPQCPACGTARDPDRDPQPVVLQHREEIHSSSFGGRTISADKTYGRLESHVSPITGVVRSLEVFGQPNEDGLTHTYAAGHNFALMDMDINFVLENMRGRSGGKGSTDVQARVSAIGEAIERYSAVCQGDEPTRRASLSEIGDAALHPNSIMLFSESQYNNRDEWNGRQNSGFHQVPEPFDIERAIDWTPMHSLRDDVFRYVPSAYCYFGHPDLQQWFFSTSDSNGNAAGNTLEEAILQGFLELVERDAVALFWYNRIARPGIDLDSVDDPYIQSLRSFYRDMGRDLWVLDITSDLGIPVFAGVSPRIDGKTEDIIVGFGAHLNPKIALMRAVTEVNQFLPAVEQRDANNNTIYWFHEQEAIHWWMNAKIAEQTHLVPLPASRMKRADEFTDLTSGDLKTDVEYCVKLAAARGLDTLVLDQTQPDVGMPVAKVIVPGLRHFWKRFGKGRLYDAPVDLGWLDKPRAESELNPIGIFF
jgi:bacteriocin biosynthesis cyclodehydratase domain-containing protein